MFKVTIPNFPSWCTLSVDAGTNCSCFYSNGAIRIQTPSNNVMNDHNKLSVGIVITKKVKYFI